MKQSVLLTGAGQWLAPAVCQYQPTGRTVAWLSCERLLWCSTGRSVSQLCLLLQSAPDMPCCLWRNLLGRMQRTNVWASGIDFDVISCHRSSIRCLAWFGSSWRHVEPSEGYVGTMFRLCWLNWNESSKLSDSSWLSLLLNPKLITFHEGIGRH